MKDLELVKEKFEKLLNEQLKRVENMKLQGDFIDYKKLDKITIGVCGGDGIGPAITDATEDVLKFLLKNDIDKGRIIFKKIAGLTIERRAAENVAIPEDVLKELKECDVILKGPTTTPRKGDPWINVESANVAMRKELDLFANVRPVSIPNDGIDWTFFRENTEGAYAVGKEGVDVTDDLAVDFTIVTTQGCERIIRTAFEFAKNNNKPKITAITKANIIKTTDGKFLEIFYKIGEEYPMIEQDDWYIDIMTAKLIDPNRRKEFSVMVAPNLYGDIITDEAAEFQGGVGTAGSANIGKKYSMFEAIHGSAPRMVAEGRDIYADPSSVMRAGAMLLAHIGYTKESDYLNQALEICTGPNKKMSITGRNNGATSKEYSKYVMETIQEISK